MEQGLELASHAVVGERAPAKLRPVELAGRVDELTSEAVDDGAVTCFAGPREFVRERIGVDDRNPAPRKRGGDDRFAAADAAGEPDGEGRGHGR
jgi:hypothetical protein